MTLGNRIRQLRLASRLSQDKVAELIGVSRQAVTKWESGKSAPSTENLLRLADIFGCSLDELVGVPPEPHLQAVPQAPDAKRHALKDKWHSNLRAAFLFAGIWLVWFFLCKLIWADLGDQTVLHWLFGDSPRHHDYLFGWLLKLYFPCSLIAIIPALFGKTTFCGTVTGAFIIGIPLGEYFGQIGVGPGVHQGWLIWGGIFLAGILFGILTQSRSSRDPWRSWKWQLAALLTVFVIIIFALLDPPQYT